jgi:predicted transcriptional regulator
MSKRVTIMIDDDLDKKLRLRQAKMIQQEQSSYSYSKALNEVIRKSLK